MERIIDTLFEIFPAAERAFILLRDAAGELTPVAARKRQADAAAPEEVAVSRSIVDDVVRNRRAVLSSDALSDDRFQNQVSVVNLSIRSLMCAPLAVGEEIVGVLQVDTSQGIRTFTQEDLKVLSGIAAQAAISVKNAQLYESLEMETSRRTSLERYFSPNMVELMMSGDVASELGGRTYRGTVFFSDIIGFTEISESMRPEDVVSNLNRYFQIMQKLIYDNGGNVDKFGGDAIMAFWSVPKYVEGDELRSVLTGVQMQAKVWPFNLELVAEGQRPIHMGIGINTGEFVAGNIGSEDKIEFTLIGDNVNLAARIEERAGRHQVLVSESTWERIRDRVCAVRLPAVGFKGKSGESTIYSIRGAQRSEEEWALAIPCHVDGPSGNGAGVLIAMSGSGAERQVVLNTTGDAQPGQTLELRLACPEWHAPLALQGRVMARSDLEVGAGLTYGRIVLGALQGTASLEMLCPGACLCTECSWEEMARG
jgi:adenylate cyclase